jgi:hypothetical protein
MKRDKLQSRFGVLSPTALSLGTVLCLGLVWGQAAQQTGPSSFTIGLYHRRRPRFTIDAEG